MKFSNKPGDILVTHALGSCVGIAIYDPVMLSEECSIIASDVQIDKEKLQKNPLMFGDTGNPLLFQEIYKYGSVKSDLRIVMAEGANIFQKTEFFYIGNRNITIARKLFWKNNVMISAENTGSNSPEPFILKSAAEKHGSPAIVNRTNFKCIDEVSMSFSILIADDSEIIREVLVRTLHMTNISFDKIHKAANGSEALTVLKDQWVDIVFTDIHMPIMGGIELIKTMRNSSELKEIPVVVISTEGSSARIEELKNTRYKRISQKTIYYRKTIRDTLSANLNYLIILFFCNQNISLSGTMFFISNPSIY
jgi:chemotaxis protein CheD